MADSTWVAFLRGMNLGRRRLTNDELVEAFGRCGSDGAEAYQASGNVVFQDGRDRDELVPALEGGLRQELGYPVPVFLRRGDEVRAIAAVEPFTEGETASSRGKPQVIFLTGELSRDALDEIAGMVPPGDRVVISGTELHWLPAAGLSTTHMDLRRLDDITGGTTIRTHATIRRLSARFLEA
jgi:uncharacterized protein (DUF1697 family)